MIRKQFICSHHFVTIIVESAMLPVMNIGLISSQLKFCLDNVGCCLLIIIEGVSKMSTVILANIFLAKVPRQHLCHYQSRGQKS